MEVPFKILVAGSISTFMLTLNSSTNFVIYAWMSKEFRTALAKKIPETCKFWKKVSSDLIDEEVNNENHQDVVINQAAEHLEMKAVSGTIEQV